MKTSWILSLFAVVVFGQIAFAQTGASPEPAALKLADKLFKDQHWAEAQVAYDTARDQEKDWHTATTRRAVEGAVTCAIKLEKWGDASHRAEDYVAHVGDSLEEVYAQHVAATVYVTALGNDRSGDDRSSSSRDRPSALARLERARDLAARLAAQPGDADPAVAEARRVQLEQERIGIDFDLATMLTQEVGEIIDWTATTWWSPAPIPRTRDLTGIELADARAEDTPNPNDNPPVGLPRLSDGKPRFLPIPPAYIDTLVIGEKIRFLLAEVERLDTSAARDDAARAILRRVMLARQLYGPDATAEWMGWREQPRTSRTAKPTRSPIPATRVWQLGDDQALVPVDGRLELLDLPAEESPLALLRELETRCTQSSVLPEARLTRALFFQSRQQFPQALAAYRAFLTQYPADPRGWTAQKGIKEVEQAAVKLDESGVHLAGNRPKITFTSRNATSVEFTARRFDMVRYAEDTPDGKAGSSPRLFGQFDWNALKDKVLKKYADPQPVAIWSEALPPEQGSRAVEGATVAPLDAPGAYLVEARVAGGEEPSRVIVLVTDLMLVRKPLLQDGKSSILLLACDARTGQPLADRAVRVYEKWTEVGTNGGKPKGGTERQTLITDANGAVVYQRKHSSGQRDIEALMVGEGGRLAFSSFEHMTDYWSNPEPRGEVEDRQCYVVFDRPAYRPGATVHFCLWLREKRHGVLGPPAAGPVKMSISSPGQGDRSQKLTLQSDALGVAAGEFALDAKAALGNYRLEVGDGEDSWGLSQYSFTVEEYRLPEFEVNVRPSTKQARLGEKFKATIEARYYFGAPVTQARVTYKVYRETYEAAYFEPGEYDWLYGKGYGLDFYPYPWLPWWSAWGGKIGWGGDQPSRPPGLYRGSTHWEVRELVSQGEADLGADGRYELEIDTARAKAERGGQDHQYTIEAAVRGTSRRVVEGQGSVVATRQEFSAYVQTEHGWYASRDETRVQIRTLTPSNAPVAARGEVVVSRVRYGGVHHDEVTEEEEKRWDAETGADGRLSFTYPLPGEGQYHVSFRTHDSWQQEVQGNAVFWVRGPQFDGRAYRFNALEIITDQRAYKVGDTAHLLVNTAEDNARILFADRTMGDALQRYRFVSVPGRSVVVDVPIDESCFPNMWVEATVVSNGRVRTETCELIVPPESKMLNVSVRPDKPIYQPGEKGNVHVEVTDRAGKPATGIAALTVFDKAVTYIQPEAADGPLLCFHAQQNEHDVAVESSFEQAFESDGSFNLPEYINLDERAPEGWDYQWKIGAGLRASPLLRAIRDLDRPRGGERIVVTGSNIPTEAETSTARLGTGGDDGAVSASATPAKAPAPTALARSPVSSRFDGGEGQPKKVAEAHVRTRFADTALWMPALKLDEKGVADAEITFPESLTTWRVHGYAINAATQVGDGTAEATTSKKLLVRLLSPRFFTERDEATLSAAVNNYLPEAQDLTAELILPAAQFQGAGESVGPSPETDADGNLHLLAHANVSPNSEHRFDWPVKVLRAGLATITAKALTTQESDGARLAFPVEVHGLDKALVQTGSLRTGPDESRTLHIDVPAEIDPEKTRLEITLTPSLAGVLIDALPYLADYPYGCVEQTASRFYPSVLVRDTLKRLGTDLEAVGNQRRQMNPADLGNRFGESPVYDSARLDRMIREGLRSLYDAQSAGGAWGWWPGDGPSSMFISAFVLQALQAAKAAGVSVDESVYREGFEYLQRMVNYELDKPKEKQMLGDEETQVYLAYVLSLEPKLDDGKGRKWLDRLYARREKMNNYGRALLALALQRTGRDAQARTVLRNLLQFVERDDTNETAWVRTPAKGWWFWWNNDIETNAWALKALVALDPKNDLAPRLVKWLLNNRRGGSYWRSTRDTAQVISAMTDYLLASGEGMPDNTLSVSIDGQPAREVRVTRENLFTFDNRVVRLGDQLKPGPHEIVVHRNGTGALYYSCRLTYFTREEGVKRVGDEIAVERTYVRLVPKVATLNLPPPSADGTTSPTPDQPSGRTEQHAGFTRVPLQDGDELKSGEQIEVTLKITAKNTYDYLAFEDRKPAGCEPVDLRSGERYADGFCANVELRDAKTVFFVGLLEQGEHVLNYRLRAETPGKFHALPTTGAAMYAPEIRANSEEMRLNIRD